MTRAMAAGFAIGAALGLGGTFAPSDALRGLAWGIDGIGIIVASAIATIYFTRKENDLLAAGFLVFAIGESLLVGSAAMSLEAGAPMFGGGVGLWAVGLVLVGSSKFFPVVVRLIGLIAALLFAMVAVHIFYGHHLTPLSSPLPFFAYPVLVLTMIGWIWTLLRGDG
jgi:hypothetical protein